MLEIGQIYIHIKNIAVVGFFTNKGKPPLKRFKIAPNETSLMGLIGCSVKLSLIVFEPYPLMYRVDSDTI